MKKLAVATAAMLASAPSAFAATCVPDPLNPLNQICSVPEISALEGTAALAVVAAIVLMVWERRRRA